MTIPYSSASDYIPDSFGGISQTFTDVEILSTSEINVVAKAKHYERRWRQMEEGCWMRADVRCKQLRMEEIEI